MNFAAVYHRSTPDMCYSPDGSEVVVNIRTGREVDAVYLVHEDPFIHELNRRREASLPIRSSTLCASARSTSG